MFEFKPQAYADSEIIFSIGDLAEHLYFIEDGQVDLVNTQGNVFASAFAGQSFGEAAILEGGVVIPPISKGLKSRTVMQLWPNAASG